MSNPLLDKALRQSQPALFRLVCLLIILAGICFPPPMLLAGDEATESRALPLLVKARQGDTPVTLAERYLNDAAKAWTIVEYNGLLGFSEGQAVLVPTAPFRLGGLSPSGYQSVPVLAYTTVSPDSKQEGKITPSIFEEQMSWLDNSGYKSISPAQLLDFMNFSGQIPKQAALITADTESSLFFDRMIPVLRSFGFTATLFVATDRVGKPGNMTWDQLRLLHETGFAIGCRGASGRALVTRQGNRFLKDDFARIESELQAAKQAVEQHVGSTCTVLAYPVGSANDLVAAMAAKLGFSLAFNQSVGENPFFGDRFGIHRIVIDKPVHPGDFTRMLTTLITADLD